MAQNDFLQFDENNENVLTQDAYREDEQRKSGAKSGVARSSLFNKVLRQVSTFVAGFGQFISGKNINILEDIDSVKNALTNLFTAKNVGVSIEVQSALGVIDTDSALSKIGNKLNNSGLNAFAKPVLIKSVAVNTSTHWNKIANWDEMYGYDIIVIHYNLNVYFKNLYNGSNILRVHFTSSNISSPNSGLEDFSFIISGSGLEGTKNFNEASIFGISSSKVSYALGGKDYAQRILIKGDSQKYLIFYSNGVGSNQQSGDSFGLFLYAGLDKAGDVNANFNISGDLQVYGYKFNHD